VCARARVCVRVCVFVCVLKVCVCVCACVRTHTHTHTRTSRGAVAARVGNPKDMGEYVGYKVLFLALTVVMQLSLHRVWWDGCGVLSDEVLYLCTYIYMYNI